MQRVSEMSLIDAMVTEIKDLMPELAEREISGVDSLKDLGLNSMDRVDVIMAAQNEAGANLPMTQFVQARNIGDIARRLLEAV